MSFSLQHNIILRIWAGTSVSTTCHMDDCSTYGDARADNMINFLHYTIFLLELKDDLPNNLQSF